MSIAKTGGIDKMFQGDALITLKEDLDDYASPQSIEIGEKMIDSELCRVENPQIKEMVSTYLDKLRAGERDFRV